MEMDDCEVMVRDRDGRRGFITRSCMRNVTDTERYRVPSTPLQGDAQARLSGSARKRRLTPPAMSAVNACKAAYPEEKK